MSSATIEKEWERDLSLQSKHLRLGGSLIQRGIMQEGPGFLLRAAHPPSSATVLAENSTVTVGPRLGSSGALGAPGAIAVLTASGTEILPPNGCLAPKHALRCQPKSSSEN